MSDHLENYNKLLEALARLMSIDVIRDFEVRRYEKGTVVLEILLEKNDREGPMDNTKIGL